MGLSPADYERAIEKLQRAREGRERKQARPPAPPKRRDRFFRDHSPEGKAKRTADGILFDSKAEGAFYLRLKDSRDNGTPLRVNGVELGVVETFAHRPQFFLAGARYTADFVVSFRADFRDAPFPSAGRTVYFEVKGKTAPHFRERFLRTWRRNAVQVATMYKIRIELAEIET